MVNETLIARCIREEAKAQYELYRALHPQMMAICSRYERNKQDAVARMNQGFFKILTNLAKRRPDVPFELWTRRVMINTIIDDFRQQKQRKEQESLDAPLDDMDRATANDYLRDMEADAFNALLQRVPEMSRRVFNLFAVDGYPHQEIAALLGISEGTSKWHVSHARQVLQQALAQQARTSIKTALS